MWGYSLSFWESIVSVANVITAVAGAIAVISAFIAAVIGTRVTEVIQRESNEKIALAGQKAAEANERASVADKKAAEANEKAEQEQLARLRIEEKLAPRSLSQPQALVDKLKPFSGTLLVIRILLDNNPDAVSLAKQLRSVVQAAGWQANTQRVSQGEDVSGVVVRPSASTNTGTSEAARKLVEALASDGIKVTLETPPANTNNQQSIVFVTIGTKL